MVGDASNTREYLPKLNDEVMQDLLRDLDGDRE
jgi:hypothetical protein